MNDTVVGIILYFISTKIIVWIGKRARDKPELKGEGKAGEQKWL